MRVTYQYSPDWKKLTLLGANFKRVLPQAKKKILYETSIIILKEADRRVHVITGRTKASGNIHPDNENQTTITYEYGGAWEERRGPPHDFLHVATIKGSKEMVRIAQKYITDAVNQSL
jgi:hypothetical protein